MRQPHPFVRSLLSLLLTLCCAGSVAYAGGLEAVPPWWTPARSVTALAVAIGICMLALLWIGVLSVRVRRQARALTTQFERTAALQQRWSDLVDNASDAILTWDRLGRFTSLNKTAQHMLGLSEEQAMQRTLENIVAAEPAAVVDRLLQRSRPQAGDRIKLEVIDSAGRHISLDVNVQATFEHGEHVGFQAIARDTTQHTRMERARWEARDAAEDGRKTESRRLAIDQAPARVPAPAPADPLAEFAVEVPARR